MVLKILYSYRLFFFIFLLEVVAFALNAEVRYINDVNYIPLRVGPGSEYKIIHKGIATGTQVEVLEVDEEAGQTLVKVFGREGYIPTQYLSSEIPARVQLTTLQEQFESVKKKNRSLTRVLSEKEARLAELTKKLTATDKTFEEKAKELAEVRRISSNPLATQTQNNELLSENGLLSNMVQKLEKENESLKADYYFSWFVYGAGAVFFGALLGVILLRISARRRSDWS